MNTNNNTVENNKLIAEFLGKRTLNGFLERYVETSENIRFPNGDLICGWQVEAHESKVNFHTDWNWLMEVVEKIEDLNYSIEINKQEENDYQCLVVKKNILIQEFSNTKIEATYKACILFIKWYNENK